MQSIVDTDILYEIMKYFRSVELYAKHIYVCKLWNEVCIEERTRNCIDDITQIYYSNHIAKRMYFVKSKFPCIRLSTVITDRYIEDLTPLKGIHTLTMKYCEFITDLTPLRGIHTLDINLMHIRNLSGLEGIHTLKLVNCNEITDLTPLRGIHTLSLLGCFNIHDLTGIEGVNTLDISDCSIGYNALKPLKGIYSLFIGASYRTSFDLSYLEGIHKLALNNIEFISYDALKPLTSLYSLFITNCSLFPVLTNCRQLYELGIINQEFPDLSHLDKLHTLILMHTEYTADISYLNNIHTLKICDCPNIIYSENIPNIMIYIKEENTHYYRYKLIT